MSATTTTTTSNKLSSSGLIVSPFAGLPDHPTLPSGFEGYLNEQQTTSLSQLREKIRQSEYVADFERDPGGDRLLLQFLRATMKDKHHARVFQVDAAFTRLVNTFQWRREFEIDDVSAGMLTGKKPDGFELFQKLYPSLDCVHEETGILVRFQRFGRFIATIDFSLLTHKQWIQGLAYESLQLQHKLRQLSVKHNREISTYVVVSDMKGISLMGVASKVNSIKMMSAIASDNFPEMMGQTLLVNCPWVFPTAFNVVKPFLDKDVVSKFVIVNDVPVELLNTYLPERNFPKEYGGDGPCILTQCLTDKDAPKPE